MIASTAVTSNERRSRGLGVYAIALVAIAFLVLPATVLPSTARPLPVPAATGLSVPVRAATTHARVQVANWGPLARDPGTGSGGVASLVARAGSPAVQPTASPVPKPPPIVPRGNPVGTIGIVAMVVVAAAGLWIYRVIRKGL